MVVRRSLIAVLIAIRGLSVSAAEEANRHSLNQAAAYLWSQQADGGGWHSPQYGVLKSGQALTPYVLHALLEVPESIAPRPEEGVERAIEFIRSNVTKVGHEKVLGLADPDLTEYPVYSTAYALRCLLIFLAQPEIADERAKLLVCTTADEGLLYGMESFLRRAQFDEEDGFTSADLAFGGWGFDAARKPGDPGHMDLAHTRRVLEALAELEASRRGFPTHVALLQAERARARSFLAVVQRRATYGIPVTQPAVKLPNGGTTAPPPFDGGFYFSPVVLSANKGRVEDDPTPHWRSYATATCDGILALLASGVPPTDPRVTAAAKWLKQHTDLDYPQGVPTDHPEPWGKAIRFYHYAVRAEVYRKLGFPAEERARLAAAVAKHQRPDGSFVNTASPLMKEDDPLLCTALAVVALSNCLSPVAVP